LVGLFVERNVTDAGSVAVFLALFFGNFYVSWMISRADLEAGRGDAVGVTGFPDGRIASRR